MYTHPKKTTNHHSHIMKVNVTIVFFLSLFISQLTAQKMGRLLVDPDNLPAVCKYHNESHRHVVPRVAKSRNTPQMPAVFQVDYDTRMPTVARNAFDFATDILSSRLSSAVPINVIVQWVALGPGALAGAGPAEFITNFPNSAERTAYPIALAEKLTGEALNNDNEPDIFIQISREQDWYYNFQDTTVIGAEQFDFVSIVLHEMIHGLGFVGFANVGGGNTGSIKTSGFTDIPDGVPSIYNVYMETGAGQNLCATLPDPSTNLGTALTNEDLFLNTPRFKQTNDAPKIYAPSSFQQGSSIHHLDQVTYRGTPNSLMTPIASLATIEHDPGISIDILYDLGWSTTTVLHEQTQITDNFNLPYVVNATVTSDFGYDASSFYLYYSRDNFTTVDSILMQPTGVTDAFTSTIAALDSPNVLQYYFSITDSRDYDFLFPAEAPNPQFYEAVFGDATAPVVQHTPVSTIDDKTIAFPMDAIVTDFFTGVDSVYVEYYVNGEVAGIALLEEDFSDEFRINLYSGVVNLATALTTSDQLEYRLVAVDKSTNRNKIFNPATGLYLIDISETFNATITYLNDFDGIGEDFQGNGFAVNQPSGFSDNGIQSQHPYPNAGTANTFNFNYQLSVPIQIREVDPLIEFEEIVLVEPGELGRNYTQLEFWDYVIVEGRKIDGQTWLPFLDGYDSRAMGAWLSAYNNGIPVRGQNSATAGTPDLFAPRTISMVENGNFQAGDVVFVRFRLFSDPFAFGWGWAIDNLRIQDDMVAVEDFITQENFKVSPNPVGEALVTIAANFKQPVTDLQLKLYDNMGRLLQNRAIPNPNTAIRETVDLSEYADGVYLVTLQINGTNLISRKLIK